MNFKRILTALIGLPLVICVFVFGNKYIIDCLMAVIACIANYEYFNASKKEVKGISWIGYVLAIGIAGIHLVTEKVVLILLLFGLPTILLILFLHIILTDMKVNLKDIAFSLLGICYVISFCAFIPLIYGIGDNTVSILSQKGILFADKLSNSFNVKTITGKYLIWYLMWASWGSDIFAYLIGKHFGKHKFSKVSPNKTVEGCLAGVIGAVILALIYTYIINTINGFDINYLAISISSAVLCIIGQIGDFAESTIKRYFEIKDSSNLFPGHGGMLDRIDSVMFIAPYAFLIFTFIL
jgi:phosphatidate cytidylyltransferase